jgi:D-alanyl-D-alanine carboxypeptidase
MAMAVARDPRPDLIGFDDPQSIEMAKAAVDALNLAC